MDILTGKGWFCSHEIWGGKCSKIVGFRSKPHKILLLWGFDLQAPNQMYTELLPGNFCLADLFCWKNINGDCKISIETWWSLKEIWKPGWSLRSWFLGVTSAGLQRAKGTSTGFKWNHAISKCFEWTFKICTVAICLYHLMMGEHLIRFWRFNCNTVQHLAQWRLLMTSLPPVKWMGKNNFLNGSNMAQPIAFGEIGIFGVLGILEIFRSLGSLECP